MFIVLRYSPVFRNIIRLPFQQNQNFDRSTGLRWEIHSIFWHTPFSTLFFGIQTLHRHHLRSRHVHVQLCKYQYKYYEARRNWCKNREKMNRSMPTNEQNISEPVREFISNKKIKPNMILIFFFFVCSTRDSNWLHLSVDFRQWTASYQKQKFNEIWVCVEADFMW